MAAKNENVDSLKNKVYNDGNIQSLDENQVEIREVLVEVIMGGNDSKLELKKELGVLYGVAVIMGLVIGGGIYISPQSVLRYAGSPGLTLLMWFLGGAFAFIGAMCFAEIGVKFPSSGGFYTYLMEFYGPYFGFLYLWQYILLIRCGFNALKITLLANTILKLFFPHCPIPSVAVKLVASFFTVLICIINCLSVKLMARSQTLMTTVSMATLLALSIVGFHYMASESVDNLENAFLNSSTDPGDIVLAVFYTKFAYGGWSALNFIVEEVKNPKRTLPVSISITMVVIICLYTLVNLSYLAVLGDRQMLESEAVAISVVLKVCPPMTWLFSVCIAITTCASYNSGVLIGSRVAFVGARNGQVPKLMSYININRYTPIISLLVQTLLTLCYISFMKIDFIIQNLTFCHLLFELMIILAFVRIRLKKGASKTEKDIFEVPLALHILYLLVLFVLCAVPMITKPVETTMVFGLIFVSTSLLYVAFIKWRPPFLANNSYIDIFSRWMQIIFSSVPPDKDI